jgi:hypothetical protein
LIFVDARQRLIAGKKPQPGVQQIALLDRFDYRWVGACEIHGRDPCLAKSRDDPLAAVIFYENARLQQNTVNAAFPVRRYGGKIAGCLASRRLLAIRLMAGLEPARALSRAELSALRNPCR